MRYLLVLAVLACGPATPDPKTPPPPQQPQCPVCPEPVKPVEVKALDRAQVHAMSTAYLEAWGKHDAAAVDGMVATSFVQLDGQEILDRKQVQDRLQSLADKKTAPWTVTVQYAMKVPGPASAVFAGGVVVHVDTDAEERHYIVWTLENGAWKVAFHVRDTSNVQREFWNSMYRNKRGFKLEANQLLIDTVKGRKAGTALDIATGQGRNALFLAKQGWKVTGIDIADEGLLQAMQAAMKDNLKLETVEAEAETWDFGTNKWDLVTLIYAGAQPKVIDKAKASLKKGGLFVCEFFAQSPDRKGGPPGFAAGEPASMFKDGWKIVKDEVVEDTADWGQDKTKLERFVAQKL